MNLFAFKLMFALSMLTLCSSVPTSIDMSNAVSTTTDDPDDLFMICSPMKSRQHLVQMLQQSGQQLKSELLASAAQADSIESPGARSNPMIQASVEKVMSVLHPGHESSSSTTPPTTSTSSTAGPMESESTTFIESTTMETIANQTEVASSMQMDQQSDSPKLMHLPSAQALTNERETNSTSKLQARDASSQRQSTLVSQLIHFLPNQIQDKLNQSNLLLFKGNPTTTTTTASVSTSTSTTVAPSTEPAESVATESVDSTADSNETEPLLNKESAQPLVSSTGDASDSKSSQMNSTTDEQNEKIFKEFFGRQNNPSSLNLIVDSVKSRLGFGTQTSAPSSSDSNAMDERKLVELQSALKNSNGPLKNQHVDEYDRFETVKTTEAPITKATLPLKQSLVDKLAAFARFTSTTTSTPSPKTVLFPAAPVHDLDAHSKLIDLKLKEKLNHLEQLKEAIDEKKKLKLPSTTTTTERTTTADYYPARPASGYSSNPSPYQKPAPARYPAVLAVPASGYQSAYGSSDGYRAVSAFRPPYENQRSGYVYPIYGY